MAIMATLQTSKKKKTTLVTSSLPSKPTRTIKTIRFDESQCESIMKMEKKKLKSNETSSSSTMAKMETKSIDYVEIEYTSLPTLPDVSIFNEKFEKLLINVNNDDVGDENIVDDNIINEFYEIIEKSNEKFKMNEKMIQNNQQKFRNQLCKIENENYVLKNENENLRNDLIYKQQMLIEYEKQCQKYSNDYMTLESNMNKILAENNELQSKIDAKINDYNNLNKKFNDICNNFAKALQNEHKKIKNFLIETIIKQNHGTNSKNSEQNETKFQLLKSLFNEDQTIYPETMKMITSSSSSKMHKRSNSETSLNISPIKSKESSLNGPASATADLAIPVVNPKYENDSEKSKNKWIDHRPNIELPLGTIMKPNFKNNKLVKQLKHQDFISNNAATKYALTHYEQTKSGVIETKIYKGNVIPSSSGGAQIIFNDIELLKQTSPTT